MHIMVCKGRLFILEHENSAAPDEAVASAISPRERTLASKTLILILWFEQKSFLICNRRWLLFLVLQPLWMAQGFHSYFNG
ncbi:hypothetical protein L6452_43343 [Arctium lappa]|uniref:Uncharacterized protein n=1 Tax=Arctium lappa TaxID=4217 RepID=A0ACB8XPW4_ARCLA|nr:hypothetical protein L6452_43343 [Arctium lappa]